VLRQEISFLPREMQVLLQEMHYLQQEMQFLQQEIDKYIFWRQMPSKTAWHLDSRQLNPWALRAQVPQGPRVQPKPGTGPRNIHVLAPMSLPSYRFSDGHGINHSTGAPNRPHLLVAWLMKGGSP
jgi:hypothetical protein